MQLENEREGHAQIDDAAKARVVSLKRPKSSHKAGRGGKCWSCLAGGFRKSSSDARDDSANCCKGCYAARWCKPCGSFNDKPKTVWVVKCNNKLALWCKSCCSSDTLLQKFCRQCSFIASSRRVVMVSVEMQKQASKK